MSADRTQLTRESEDVGQGKLLVIVFKEDGLANHLALFGHFIGFAEEYGYQLINPTFKPYARFFDFMQNNPYCAYPILRGWPSGLGNAELEAAVENPEGVSTAGGAVTVLHEASGEPYTALDTPEIRARINSSQISFAVGWKFRAVDWVQRHAEKIRRCFQPVENYVQRVAGTVHRLRQESDTVVGVHVRHGDYREWLGGKHFHPASQYATWMHQFREQFPNRKVSFLVCSDEQRSHREFPGLQVEFGCPKAPVGDLYALADCDYIFGPASTFSMWASFYGNKQLFLIRSQEDTLELNGFRPCKRLQ